MINDQHRGGNHSKAYLLFVQQLPLPPRLLVGWLVSATFASSFLFQRNLLRCGVHYILYSVISEMRERRRAEKESTRRRRPRRA